MADNLPRTRMQADRRITVWFFGWCAVMFLLVNGFLFIVLGTLRGYKLLEVHPWIILVVVGGGFICIALASMPFWRGIRCRQCRRRLKRMKVDCDVRTGNAPLRFHCVVCNVIWNTPLVSGPAQINQTSYP